jgi:uncharacterized protein with gpF-like domain
MKKRTKYVRAIRPNAGVEAAYRRALEKMVKEMSHSAQYWIEASYKANPPTLEMAMDALPSQELSKRIKEVARRWIKRFDDMADKIAKQFVESGRSTTDRAMMTAFKDAGWTVDFKMTRGMQDAMNASIVANVDLISDLPVRYATNVQGIIMRGFTAGRDLKYISEELHKQRGICMRRAAFIARDQSNKLSATVTQARCIELGLFEAEWIHSNGGKHPRPSHVKAGRDKLRFDVREGALIDGERILPGYLPNCRCGSRVILPF